MSKSFKIGFLPVTKVNWTNKIMEQQREDARAMLAKIDGAEILGGDAMIDTEDSGIAALEFFEQTRPDVIVVFFATFSLGTIVPLIAKRLKIPVVFWSISEPDPAGGRLRANSLCAANMNSHFMWRFKIPYFHVHGDVSTPKAQLQLEKTLRLVKAMKTVATMRIGSVGGRVPGFYTSCISEMLLRDKIGPEVKYITMLEVVNAAKNLLPEEVDEAVAAISKDAHSITASAEDVRKSAALFAAVRKMKKKFGVDTLTFRCWPEVIDKELYGITVCSTIGHLTNSGDLTVCEGDVYAAVTLRLEKELTGEDPFFCDLIVCEGDYAVLWHCGAAPCSLCKSGYENKLTNSSTVPDRGVINDFPLKRGRITVTRLSETRDGSGYRMLIATGEGLDTDLFVRGNPLKVKFDAGCDRVRETVIKQGFEHHFSMAYGDISEELLEYCRAMDIEPVLVK